MSHNTDECLVIWFVLLIKHDLVLDLVRRVSSDIHCTVSPVLHTAWPASSMLTCSTPCRQHHASVNPASHITVLLPFVYSSTFIHSKYSTNHLHLYLRLTSSITCTFLDFLHSLACYISLISVPFKTNFSSFSSYARLNSELACQFSCASHYHTTSHHI